MVFLFIIFIFACISAICFYSYKIKNIKIPSNIITVFCSSKNNIDEKYKIISMELIDRLDSNKIILAYGGNNGGLMSSVYNIYKKKEGRLISVNYKKFAKTKNNYIFDTIEERQNKLISLGNAYIILPGGLGTTYELFHVLVKNNIKDFKKRIYVLNIDGFFNNLINYIEELNKNNFISGGIESTNMYISNNPQDLAFKINNDII